MTEVAVTGVSSYESDALDDLPHVHDYYAVSAEFRGDTLRIGLNWVEYSRAENKDITTKATFLCFYGLTEEGRDTSEKESEQDHTHPAREMSRPQPKRAMKTMRDLIETVRHPSTALGEPLNYLERTDSAVVLVTHLSGEYLISAKRVDWCSGEVSP